MATCASTPTLRTRVGFAFVEPAAELTVGIRVLSRCTRRTLRAWCAETAGTALATIAPIAGDDSNTLGGDPGIHDDQCKRSSSRRTAGTTVGSPTTSGATVTTCTAQASFITSERFGLKFFFIANCVE